MRMVPSDILGGAGGRGRGGCSVIQNVRTFYYSAINETDILTQIANSIPSLYHVKFCVKDELICSYSSFYYVLKPSELDSEPDVFCVTMSSIYGVFFL